MWDWLLEYGYLLVPISSVIMAVAAAITALATAIMALATTIYAYVSFRTLKQLKISTETATLPSLTLDENTFKYLFPCPFSVAVKNTGFGPAFEIQPEMTGAPLGLTVNLTKSSLAPNDTLALTISAKPISYTETGDYPIYDDNIANFSGVLDILLSYKGIYGNLFTLQFRFILDSDSRQVTLG